jgi:hypothetical protein
MSGFKEPDSLKRQEAGAIAKKAALEKFRAKAADPALADRLTERAARAADRKAIKDVREAEKRAETKSCETERAQQFIVADQPTALVAELNNSAEQAAALNSARRGRQANGPRARVDPKRSRPFLFCFGDGRGYPLANVPRRTINPQRSIAADAIALTYRFRGHNGHGRTSRRFGPVANDPSR